MFFNSDGEQIDELQAHFAKNGSAVTRTISIPCYDGYEISCTDTANFSIEAKHSASGAYTNIEATPLDVSAFDGSTEDFNFRFTPGSVNGTYQPAISYGPIGGTPITYTLTDDNGNVLTDDEGNVLTT